MDGLMYQQTTGHFATPNGSRALMAYRDDTNDKSVLLACMSEDEYALRGIVLKGWALDIGGYLGGVGIGLALDHPGLDVVIVEPVPENAELCRQNAALNNVEGRVRILEAAIGAPGQKTAKVAYAYTGSESALHHAWVGNSTILSATDCTVKEVPAFSLSEIMKLIGESEPPSLLKCDSEGGEWALLLDPMCKRVPFYVGERHPTGPRTDRHAMARMLKTHDFTWAGPESGPEGFTATRRDA